VSRAIQAGASACPNGGIPLPPGAGGTLAPTPIGTALFIPFNANPGFGLPRTMLNPRQFQLAAKFSF
jgi:hypothetical protein